MQKILDTIIGDNQSVATKNVPYKSNLALTSFNFRELFTE